MDISIKTIPYKAMRYRTLGDWWFTPEGNLEIRVAEMKDWRWEFIVAFHELVEVILCKLRGITVEQVDAFDLQFEKKRTQTEHKDCDDWAEPGDDPANPAYKEHFFAENLERLMAEQMGLDWRANNYEGCDWEENPEWEKQDVVPIPGWDK